MRAAVRLLKVKIIVKFDAWRSFTTMADRKNNDLVLSDLIVDQIRTHDESKDARNGYLFGHSSHFRKPTKTLS